MRIAVSGSHSTGKSSLIAAFLDRCPGYVHEPEAFETLGDDVDLTEAGEPTPDALRALLQYTAASLERHGPGACAVFERSPVDYLAYAEASRSGAWKREKRRFRSEQVPVVRAALQRLDLIVLLPAGDGGPIQGRPGEDARYRRRVDEWLRRILVDDEYDFFADGAPAEVCALPAHPGLQLQKLVALAGA